MFNILFLFLNLIKFFLFLIKKKIIKKTYKNILK